MLTATISFAGNVQRQFAQMVSCCRRDPTVQEKLDYPALLTLTIRVSGFGKLVK